MNHEAISYMISPVKRASLCLADLRRSGNRIVSGFLVSPDGSESFRIAAGIPLLLPPNYTSEWTHPVYEILLGNEALRVVSSFAEDGPEKFEANLSDYIKERLGRSGVVKAFEAYGSITMQQRYESFIRIPEDERSAVSPAIPRREFAKGLHRVRSQTAEERLRRMTPDIAANHLSEYADSIAETNPEVLVELGCGACFGTQSVVERYKLFKRLFPIDVDFVCTKVAEGLYTYQDEIHRIDPVVASFWFLPFRNDSVDCAFTRNALRESREVDQVLREIHRVLKPGGRFVCLEGSEPSFALPLFDELGFSASERRELASIARLYAGADNLCEVASSNGMMVISRKEISPPKHWPERILLILGNNGDREMSMV